MSACPEEQYKLKTELDLNSSSGDKLHRSLQCVNVSRPALSLRQEDRQNGELSSSDEEEEDLTNETVQNIILVDRKESRSKDSINARAVSSSGLGTSQDTAHCTRWPVYLVKEESGKKANIIRSKRRMVSAHKRGRSSSEGTSLLKDQSEHDDKPTKKDKKARREKKGWRKKQSKPVGEKEMKTKPYAIVAQGSNNVSTDNKHMDIVSVTMGDNCIPARGESTFVNSPTQAPAVVSSISDEVKEIDLSQVSDDIMLIREQTSQLNKLGQSISQMIKCGQESCKTE